MELRSVPKLVKRKEVKNNRKNQLNNQHSLAMNRHRANVHIFTLLLMMILRLIDQFDHATRHLRHLTLNRWPTVILKLGHFYGVLHLTVGHIEFASRVIRTTFTLHVLDHNVLVLDFIVGPIARTFLWSVTNLTKDNNCFLKRHTSGKKTKLPLLS